MAFQIAQDPAADRVLEDSAFALLAGMMLDQQYPMEHAFRGPAKILERFGTLEPASITFGSPGLTRAYCKGESTFLKVLVGKVAYSQDYDVLTLTAPDGSGLQFRATG